VVLLSVALADSALGQDQSAQTGRFYGRIVSGAWTGNILTAKATKPVPVIGPATSTTPLCSIPLLEATIPKDTDFAMRQIHSRMDALAAMPQAKPPAPSCEVSQTDTATK
jgi:hypothetical protein